MAGAPDPGDALDRHDARLVHDEVEIDPRVNPELEAGEIGGRRACRHRQAAAAPQITKHARCRRKGGHNDVRLVALDEPEQPSCAEQGKPRSAEATA